MKARSFPLQGQVSNGSFPVISPPSLRHENILEVCRIHSSILSGIMTTSRLHLPGLTFSQRRIPVGLSLTPYVESRFRQMARHGSNRLPMTLPSTNPLIQSTNMPLGVRLPMQANRMGRLHIRPLQVLIHIRPHPSIPRLIPT